MNGPIRFIWCPAHHANGMVRQLYPLEEETTEYHGIWVCQNCGGHVQKSGSKSSEVAWEAVSNAV